LFEALSPTLGTPGQLQEDIPFGVRVGYGGPAMHPGGKITIAGLAAIHQGGLGHVPKREIIVPPDDRTISLMAGDMQRAIRKLTDEANQ
jgi:hypothetical protein